MDGPSKTQPARSTPTFTRPRMPTHSSEPWLTLTPRSRRVLVGPWGAPVRVCVRLQPSRGAYIWPYAPESRLITTTYAIEWLAKAPHGRAADDFGWRNELLRYLDDEASNLLASFLIELIQLGPESLPPVVVAMMRFGRLVLLDKDPAHNAAALNDPSLAIKAPRPIGVLSLFRRLAGGIAMSATRPDLATYFDIEGFQRGIS